MTLIRWNPSYNPSRELVSMQDEMNRFVDSFFNGRGLRSAGMAFTPVVDIEESPEEFVLRADLPGISQKDVKVSLMGDTVTIRGERKYDQTQNETSMLRAERVHGSFERSFTLGTALRGDKVKAIYRDGVLEVHVPKSEEARMREVEIQIG
ncbi:MAG: Hsp20/alpha crystallin family protein [Acidimicrobiia bacterium]